MKTKHYTLCFLSVLVSLSSFVYASPTDNYNGSKIESIQNIYHSLLSNELMSGNDLIYQIASPNLKGMFDRDSELADGGIACIDYDFVIQGQDLDKNEITNSIVIKETGRFVRVSFSNFNKNYVLHYKFTCDNHQCLIDDIISKQGSIKKNTHHCLDSI